MWQKLCQNIDIQNYITALIRYYHDENNLPEYIYYNDFLDKQCEILTEYFVEDYLYNNPDFITNNKFIAILLVPFSADVCYDYICSNEFVNKFEKIVIPDYIKKIINKIIKNNE